MIRRLAPRRLGTDEEATVVEHLTELRHRLLIALFAIVPAFLVCFYFHTDLIELLKRNKNNVTYAAQDAGIDRKSIQRMMKKHGIRVEEL